MNVCAKRWDEMFPDGWISKHVCTRPCRHEDGTSKGTEIHRCACGICLDSDNTLSWNPVQAFVEAEEIDMLKAARKRIAEHVA